MRYGFAALLLLGASLGVAGCGSSSGGSEATPVSVQTASDERTESPSAPPAEPAPPEAEPPAESPPTESESSVLEPSARPLPGLPRFTAGYEDWLRLNEDPIPPREGGDAHLSTKNVYASKEASRSGSSLTYPVGTVIVKEGVRPGTDFIGLIATMRKAKGADPEHEDWIFVEWARDRGDAPFEELARDATCWGCHSDAAATDYVWVQTLDAP